jgi:hypothetical protein
MGLALGAPNIMQRLPCLPTTPYLALLRRRKPKPEGNADFIVTLNPKDFSQERLRAKVISPETMA